VLTARLIETTDARSLEQHHVRLDLHAFEETSQRARGLLLAADDTYRPGRHGRAWTLGSALSED
jgi:hypothetical protein